MTPKTWPKEGGTLDLERARKERKPKKDIGKERVGTVRGGWAVRF